MAMLRRCYHVVEIAHRCPDEPRVVITEMSLPAQKEAEQLGDSTMT
jgi:hypothetical protein